MKLSNKTLMPRRGKTWLGQMFFSIMSHSLYDVGLYRFVTPYIWRCPTSRLMDNYVENISAHHLEIGVGSGYFLKRTMCADFVKRLVLADMNLNCLRKSAKRLRMSTPRICHHNILQPFSPLPLERAKFSSVAMNYVLHCIPGTLSGNQHVFQHVHDLLREGGVFFGATLIQQPVHQGIASWLFMKLLNAVGIFQNGQHTSAELQQALASRFRKVEISMVGNAAVFRAVK
ncbi:MAG: methyltransferase domain-containing protein [Pseudomonadales bacterium]|nr:methyltransferase domain-containing protein [Pseudomonadales bacterium]